LFELHPRLRADTFLVTKMEVSSLYLMNDARYKWLILVPEIEGLKELHELGVGDYSTVTSEIKLVSETLAHQYSPKKINIGALGNMVEQLHIHIIARNEGDFAWPDPVWGAGEATPYSPELSAEILSSLKNSISL